MPMQYLYVDMWPCSVFESGIDPEFGTPRQGRAAPPAELAHPWGGLGKRSQETHDGCLFPDVSG